MLTCVLRDEGLVVIAVVFTFVLGEKRRERGAWGR